MQFAGVPLNLLARKPARKAVYCETGHFSRLANVEAQRYGNIVIAASGRDSSYDRIPEFTRRMVDDDASYAFITSNNTIYGTQYPSWPDMGDMPLVIDATSDIFSRPVDFSKTGVVFAGLQKNLGPAGTALVIVREDLIGHAQPATPTAFDYRVVADNDSMFNTPPTWAIYMAGLVFRWIQAEGGVAAMAARNAVKATLLYGALDASGLFVAPVAPGHRSRMNVVFRLRDERLDGAFLKGAQERGLAQLKGHRSVGGMRASIYNAMPIEGVQALVDYLREFERAHG
jgi:phosphoserine aminotransferase